MTNEIKKKVTKVIIIAAVAVAVSSAILSGARCHFLQRDLGQCRAELARVEQQLAYATDEQQHLTDTIEECREVINDSAGLLSKSVTTVGELQAALRVLRAKFEEMENILSHSNSHNYRDNRDHSDSGKEQ